MARTERASKGCASRSAEGTRSGAHLSLARINVKAPGELQTAKRDERSHDNESAGHIGESTPWNAQPRTRSAAGARSCGALRAGRRCLCCLLPEVWGHHSSSGSSSTASRPSRRGRPRCCPPLAARGCTRRGRAGSWRGAAPWVGGPCALRYVRWGWFACASVCSLDING